MAGKIREHADRMHPARTSARTLFASAIQINSSACGGSSHRHTYLMALLRDAFPILCLILLVICLQFPPSLPYASFLFGDSLVDTGNNDYLFTLAKADFPPYGIDFILSGGIPTGRFTNGRTISDIIGQAMGARLFPPPYLAPNARDDTIYSGVNYASGASGILDETGSLFIGRVPLGQQISYFEETRDYLIKTLGKNATNEFLTEAIFCIISGSNDILDYLEPSIPFFGKDKVAPTSLQDTMVSNMSLYLRRLHELGARKFVVAGVGPLGCTPYVKAIKLELGGGCSSVVNRLVQCYNIKLSKRLDELNLEFGPNTVFVYVNSYDIFIEIIRNSRRYGFENVNDPCCGGEYFPFLCFKGPDANSGYVPCADRSKYVFWDAFHPTEAANMIVAKKLLDGSAHDIYPINIRKLYSYVI